jgi:hypothetical protein
MELSLFIAAAFTGTLGVRSMMDPRTAGHVALNGAIWFMTIFGYCGVIITTYTFLTN